MKQKVRFVVEVRFVDGIEVELSVHEITEREEEEQEALVVEEDERYEEDGVVVHDETDEWNE